jgi:DnaJ homolog subfamily A member 5
MGQRQSSEKGGSEPVIRTSYYSLIGVERDATDDEIKRAYRRRALELHPDRNYGNEENATAQFAEIQAAYEVLSDPQERAWYDSHEGAILRGFEGTEDGGESFGYNIKLTTSDDVARVMNAIHGRKIDYDNVPPRFFTDLGELFEKLGAEETIAARMEGVVNPDYPVFGVREDDYETVVKPFYTAWGGFSTIKTYFWADKYNLADGEDRRIRRLMEKENKKVREDAVREFNDTVRMLVSFVRKRDPRYKPNFQTDAERQKALREASAAQAARSRAANQARMSEYVPEWTKAPEAEDNEEEEEEDVITDHFECVACNKTFKSEKQFEAHERSKKHQQTVKALIRKMKKENAALDLDADAAPPVRLEDDDDDNDNDEIVKEGPELEDAMENLEVSTGPGDLQEPQPETSKRADEEAKGSGSTNEDGSDDDDDLADEYASREEVLSRIGGGTLQDAGQEYGKQTEKQRKLGKAAQKRARKAAQQAVSSEQEEEFKFKCARCDAAFPSRTRLFQHIKDFGHAAPIPQGGKKKVKR